MTNWTKCSAVERNPGKISGAWAFTGTRVPAYARFENPESGATVKEFLEWNPDVEEWRVRAVLDHEVEYLERTVKVLFDHGAPAALRRHLEEHTVDRSAERGWELPGNGESERRSRAAIGGAHRPDFGYP